MGQLSPGQEEEERLELELLGRAGLERPCCIRELVRDLRFGRGTEWDVTIPPQEDRTL